MLSVKECDETASLFREAYLDSYTATLRVGIERALRQARALAVLADWWEMERRAALVTP